MRANDSGTLTAHSSTPVRKGLPTIRDLTGSREKALSSDRTDVVLGGNVENKSTYICNNLQPILNSVQSKRLLAMEFGQCFRREVVLIFGKHSTRLTNAYSMATGASAIFLGEHMTWTTPAFEEVCLNCEINSYASAKL